MRRTLGFLLLVMACHHDVVVTRVPVTTAPSSAAIARVPPVAPPAPFAYDAFTSTDENEFAGWQIFLARRGDDVRVVLHSRGMASLPVELAGTAKDEGARVHLGASAGDATDALRFDGWIDGDAMRGVLKTDTGREDVSAKRGLPPLSETTQGALGGDASGHRFVLAWEQHGKEVKAELRELSGPRELAGTVRDGRFELAGGGVTMRGVLSNVSGIGEWIENGESRSLTLDPMTVSYPAARALAGGVRVLPSDRWVRGASGCPSSYDVFPKVDALDLRTQNAMNRLLAPGASTSTKCTGESEIATLGAAWSTSTYAITASRPGWFAIRRSLYGYMGGAHGMGGETCDVANVSTGKVASLQSELPATSIAKLGPLVRKAILAAEPGKTLMDLGFNADDPDVTRERVMCVVDDHGALALEVVYQNEDAAGNFRFSDVRPHVPAAAVRALFPAGSVGALVFQ